MYTFYHSKHIKVDTYNNNYNNNIYQTIIIPAVLEKT